MVSLMKCQTLKMCNFCSSRPIYLHFSANSNHGNSIEGMLFVKLGKDVPGSIYKNCEKLNFRDLEPSD